MTKKNGILLILGGSRSSSTSESDGLSSPRQPDLPDLDRSNDNIYNSTTSVVRSVMVLTKEASNVKAEEYTNLVKVKIIFYLRLTCHGSGGSWLTIDTYMMSTFV